jgi:hypothetical protein
LAFRAAELGRSPRHSSLLTGIDALLARRSGQRRTIAYSHFEFEFDHGRSDAGQSCCGGAGLLHRRCVIAKRVFCCAWRTSGARFDVFF